MRQTTRSQIDPSRFRSKWEDMSMDKLMEEESKLQEILSGPIPNGVLTNQYIQIRSNLTAYIQHREGLEPEGKAKV